MTLRRTKNDIKKYWRAILIEEIIKENTVKDTGEIILEYIGEEGSELIKITLRYDLKIFDKYYQVLDGYILIAEQQQNKLMVSMADTEKIGRLEVLKMYHDKEEKKIEKYEYNFEKYMRVSDKIQFILTGGYTDYYFKPNSDRIELFIRLYDVE